MNARIRVLIAEDDDNDAFLVWKVIRKVDPSATFYVVDNGSDGKYADRNTYPSPPVLITDLKMPKVNGFELLTWLKDHPSCNAIPKVVLSASNLTEGVIKANQLGANIFFKKPGKFNDLVALVDMNFRVWSMAELPPDDIEKCG